MNKYLSKQAGFSSFVILGVVVLGIFIAWELNEAINQYNLSGQLNRDLETGPDKPKETFCPTGDINNCNDSDDQFILDE